MVRATIAINSHTYTNNILRGNKLCLSRKVSIGRCCIIFNTTIFCCCFDIKSTAVFTNPYSIYTLYIIESCTMIINCRTRSGIISNSSCLSNVVESTTIRTSINNIININYTININIISECDTTTNTTFIKSNFI